MVVHGTGPQTLLDTYEEERLPIAKSVLRWTRLVAKAVGPNHWIVRNRVFARHQLMFCLLRLPALRSWILLKVSQVQINYRKSTLSESVGAFVSRLPGLAIGLPTPSV